MRSLRVARSFLRQAGARLEDAEDALGEANHPYAVRLSQECVELSLKAVLRSVGIEYPKVHEVSYVLEEVGERFPGWFRVEIGYMAESSRLLFKKREPSLYGNEEALLPPDGVMSEEDAKDATQRANKTFHLCERLVEELESRVEEPP
ncbi:MAG: HEPN domain-containing protein [Candidatus Bathyarchaeota archaeon]|nr:HEPN domain-containing protein [Candidatus Bathyarchaeota archaeon]